jgi:MoxR-like ATPase
VFKPGPLFANVILADEINRTTPRTQSALLEAMSDRQVSIEGKTHLLSLPFIVLATQNPYEFEGTYVLPESQLDRFMIRLRMGYPIRSEERKVFASHRNGEPVESLGAVLSGDDVLRLQRGVRQVRVDDAITDYLLDIVHATRRSDDLHVGVSTRGALTLYRAAQSVALVSGRSFVVPDDIKALAVPVLAHRVLGKSFLQSGEFGAAEAIIRDIVERVRVPA